MTDCGGRRTRTCSSRGPGGHQRGYHHRIPPSTAPPRCPTAQAAAAVRPRLKAAAAATARARTVAPVCRQRPGGTAAPPRAGDPPLARASLARLTVPAATLPAAAAAAMRDAAQRREAGPARRARRAAAPLRRRAAVRFGTGALRHGSSGDPGAATAARQRAAAADVAPSPRWRRARRSGAPSAVPLIPASRARPESAVFLVERLAEDCESLRVSTTAVGLTKKLR